MSRPHLSTASSLEGFTRRWQDVCRQVLRRYCELPEHQVRGKPMGMTRLRDMIMEDFDRWDGSERIKDLSLGRESLEHWMNGKYLSNSKFRYIDYWLREYRHRPSLRAVLDEVIKEKERDVRRHLSDMYHADYAALDQEVNRNISDLSGGIFYSDVVKSPSYQDHSAITGDILSGGFKQIVLYFREFSAKSVSVTAAYIQVPLSDLRPKVSRKGIDICFGYFTVEGLSKRNSAILGPMHLFRDRNRGHRELGSSVSYCNYIGFRDEIETNWFPQISAPAGDGWRGMVAGVDNGFEEKDRIFRRSDGRNEEFE